ANPFAKSAGDSHFLLRSQVPNVSRLVGASAGHQFPVRRERRYAGPGVETAQRAFDGEGSPIDQRQIISLQTGHEIPAIRREALDLEFTVGRIFELERSPRLEIPDAVVAESAIEQFVVICYESEAFNAGGTAEWRRERLQRFQVPNADNAIRGTRRQPRSVVRESEIGNHRLK